MGILNCSTCHHSKGATTTKMAILTIALVFLIPSLISGLPQAPDSACSSQTCVDCLGSCAGCDSCNLCPFCLGIKIGPCAQCKYCDNGADGCKKTCNAGKKQPACRKCIDNCS